MDPFAALIDRTRVPQTSLQRLAVISIFSKLRSYPSDTDAARNAVSQCLLANAPAVVDQAVRELCRIVSDSKMELARGLLELQSAMEGSEPQFVSLFVKGLGFLVRLGFRNNRQKWRECSPEMHPFIKILSCRMQVEAELRQQVIMIMSQHESLGMADICEFLRPLLNFSILRIPFSGLQSCLFVRSLVSSISSLACTLECDDALAVLKLLIGCLRFYPERNEIDLADFTCIAECVVASYVVVLRQLAASNKMVINRAQPCGVELVEIVLSRCTELDKRFSASDFVALSNRVLTAQREAGLQFVPQMSAVLLALTFILTKSELEYEQVPVVKLIIFLLNWENENDDKVDQAAAKLSEGILCIVPAIKLMSSPSKYVKGAASELLLVLEKLVVKLLGGSRKDITAETRSPLISRPEFMVFRLLQNVWHQEKDTTQNYFFLNLVASSNTLKKEMHLGSQLWTSCLTDLLLWTLEQRKSSFHIKYEEALSEEMSMLVCAVAGVLVLHDTRKADAVNTLSALGIVSTKLGVTILLAILFYINIFSQSEGNDMQLKLLAVLPSLASHSTIIPLIVQTILPMLNMDLTSVLYATAARLLCKTWEYNDRAFGTLQGCLQPKKFSELSSERIISISMASCIRDVCRKNPDRGVDLILSVSVCIESHDPIVKALGLESLSQLCDADVIDFYTAWNVIGKYLSVSQLDPTLAQSICLLLRWGAMDAEVYPEASEAIEQIIWVIGTSRHSVDNTLWGKAKITAFEALAHFEVPELERSIPEFKERITKLLTSECDSKLLRAIEAIAVKIIRYENINRQRLVKEKKVLGNKVEKLLEVFRQANFNKGQDRNVRELPGAALFNFSFIPKDKYDSITKDSHAGYENAMIEIASSIHLSRSVILAILTLKSWEPFMKRWMKANVASLESKRTSKVFDVTQTAASNILKSLRRSAEDSIPRTAENIALGMGALCAIMPPSVHAVKSKSTEFLLSWLSHHEHEYRQWTAALSLGVVSSGLHITDHQLKLQIVNGLLEVACSSKSTLVKGACGVGLGLSCKGLLTQAVDAEESGPNIGAIWRQELNIVEKMVQILCQIIFQLTQSSSDILKSLCSFSVSTNFENSESDLESDLGTPTGTEYDIWGVAGLVIGIGNSVCAVYRADSKDLVLKIKSMLISWVSNSELRSLNPGFYEGTEIGLSVGSCLALPDVVAFCLRVELIDNDEIDYLIRCYKDLISTLILSKACNNFHQSLLMASCVGAGNLLACILNEGVHSIEVKEIKELLELLRKCYSSPFPPLINMSGMIGVVNALGAGAGTFFDNSARITSEEGGYQLKLQESSITGPLVRSSTCEPTVTRLIQEIFVAAQNSEDNKLQQYAAWALSFLRHHLFSNVNNPGKGVVKSSPSIPDDSVVMKLSLWLMHLDPSERGAIVHPDTVATVINCLSQAPRLPTLDWGAIVRRCMRYEPQAVNMPLHNQVNQKSNVRERCLEFSLVHANKVDLLQRFLDELTDLSRFESLELNLKSRILEHLSDMKAVFSGSRLQKLFSDIGIYLSSSTSFKNYSLIQQRSLQKSAWKGIHEFLNEPSAGSPEHISYIEKYMELLFQLLPEPKPAVILGSENQCYAEIWSEAVQCLEKARQIWLLDLLQEDQSLDDENLGVKKVQTKAMLAGQNSIPLSEMGRLKSLVFNSKSFGSWDVLVEIVAALQHAEGITRREWLLDAVQMSCISSYPSVVMQFIGLLAGRFCKFMPLLILDRIAVLSDLPVTLRSLLSDPNWEPIAESVASHLFAATERIYKWASSLTQSEKPSSYYAIEYSEDAMADFLLQIMYHTCVSLRGYLPLDKQLRLINMIL